MNPRISRLCRCCKRKDSLDAVTFACVLAMAACNRDDFADTTRLPNYKTHERIRGIS
jgi:hypothetical protein